MEMLITACFLPSTRQPACAKIVSAVADARGVQKATGRAAMASTNEDMVVLATAPLDDGRQLLVMRHLPDRGTVEIGWWGREESGPPAYGSSRHRSAGKALQGGEG
jgi:hypothetical protein